jgi:membrane-bound serine protease (ClpP class)
LATRGHVHFNVNRDLLSYIIPGVLVTAAFFVFVIGQGLRAQRLPLKVGMETFVGKLANTVTPIDSHGGMVFVEGEYWNATSEVPVEKGRIVEISAVEGLRVKVEPKI